MDATGEKALFELLEARAIFFPSVSMRQTRRYASPGGVDGVRIQCVKIGAKRFVSRGAVEDFIATLFKESPRPTPAPRRYASPDDADAYSTLRRLGVKCRVLDEMEEQGL